MSLRWHCAVVGLAALSGCAGDQHEPEPLLSFHATVIASAWPLSPALVPALTFTPFVTNWGHSEFIVSGEHDGSLLSKFSLRIYEDPPAAALSVMTKGEPAMAIGGITAVSPDHPSRLDWTSDEAGHTQVCADDGECGVPSNDACGSAAAPSCLGTVVPGKNWGNHGVAGSYVALYLSEPAPAGSVYSQFFAQGRALAAGYNLLRYVRVFDSLDADARSAYYDCQDRATKSALDEFNADHGTNYTDHSMISDGGRERDVQLLADWDGAMIASTVSEGCVLPGAQQIAPKSADDMPLELVLVDWSQP
jgi:hypothetical protein